MLGKMDMKCMFKVLFHYTVILIYFFAFTGCTTKLPSKPIDSRVPTPWKVGRVEYTKPSFSVSATFESDANRLLINGRVVQSDCQIKSIETRDVPTQYYSNTHSEWMQDWKTERRIGATRTHKWKPTSVTIKNPYGQNGVTQVGPDGTFRVSLQGGRGVYFSKPALSKYFSAKSVYGRSAIVAANGAPSGLSASTTIQFPSTYAVEANINLAAQYVRNQIATYTIVCYDKNSRVPIMPRLQVTTIDDPTLGHIRAALTREFGGNQELVSVGLQAASGVMWKGAKLTNIDQDIRFKAWKGSSLKISASHPKY